MYTASTSGSASSSSYAACRLGTLKSSPNRSAKACARLATAVSSPLVVSVRAAAKERAIRPVPRIPHRNVPLIRVLLLNSSSFLFQVTMPDTRKQSTGDGAVSVAGAARKTEMVVKRERLCEARGLAGEGRGVV